MWMFGSRTTVKKVRNSLTWFSHEWADATTLLAPLENVVVEAESKQGVVVWSSAQKDPPAIPTDSFPLHLAVLTGDDIQRHLPETLHVEATGLGGRDLSYPIPWDISTRTDKEGQAVYGPSLAPLEETVVVPGLLGGTQTLQVSALGRSKAAHEFLVLHYFALDSAKHWKPWCPISCQQSGSRVLQPVGPLHWKC